MTEPQISDDTRYIGPDFEMWFMFSDETIGMTVFNTGDADAMINWDQATFVSTTGDAVRLISTGGPLIYAIPAGTRASVELTPATWFCKRPKLWNRRAHLRHVLVHASDADLPGNRVRVILPIRKMGLDGSTTDETFQFVFEPTTKGTGAMSEGGYGGSQLF